MKIAALLLLGTTLLVSACGPMIQKQNEQNRFLVAAQPLEIGKLIEACKPEAGNGVDKISCVSAIIADSQEKCASFLDGLVLLENTSNTTLDIATTIFSALATVFVPLNTVHALSAASSISSGTKNAINSNIYAKASIANFGQAIQATYYKDISDYRTQLSQASPNGVNVLFEATRVQTIHRECSLASAQATIAATLAPATVSDPTVSVTLTVTRPNAAEALRLTVISQALSVPEPPLQLAASADANAIAADIVKQINGNERLKKAKITATASTPADNKVILKSPLSAAVQWIPSNVAVLVLSAAEVASTTTGSTTSSPPVTSGAGVEGIPGRRIP